MVLPKPKTPDLSAKLYIIAQLLTATGSDTASYHVVLEAHLPDVL